MREPVRTVVADPPWPYRDRLPGGGRGAAKHYKLLSLDEIYGYLPERLLREIAGKLEVPLIEVFRVANFYKAFTLKPKGRHLITVCKGTACHVRRSSTLIEELQSWLGIGSGQTTEDGLFTVDAVNCLGACALGPIVVIDGEYYDRVTPAKLRSLIGMISEG